MNIGRAEIGIILITLMNLPLGAIPFFGSLFSLILWVLFTDPKALYGFPCVITSVGLILLLSDRKGFLGRRKGNKTVSSFLAICGLIMIALGLFWAYIGFTAYNFTITEIPGLPLTYEDWTVFLLFWAWAGLMLISGILLIFYGFRTWSCEKTDFPPLKQEIDLESHIEYPEDLLAKYIAQYPHNPEGVLEWHIHKKMKEGKTREPIEELKKETV